MVSFACIYYGIIRNDNEIDRCSLEKEAFIAFMHSSIHLSKACKIHNNCFSNQQWVGLFRDVYYM